MQQNPEFCPIEHSDRLGRDFFRSNKANQESFGQYFTPLEVANYMAAMLKPINKSEVSLLDPGAGSGVLASAAIKLLALNSKVTTKFHVDLFEIDPQLIVKLKSSMESLRSWCGDCEKQLSFTIHNEDYVLTNSSVLSSQKTLPIEAIAYDYVISNPPYFKISKEDPRAIACSSIVYGQPNIYALFLAIAAGQLKIGGQLVFITPRSFASGQYFRAFRNYFFNQIQIVQLHQFVSRVDAFDRDSVLQENIIFYGSKTNPSIDAQIVISVSQGRSDLSNSSTIRVKESEILDRDNDSVLSLPASKRDLRILDLVSGWTNNLEAMNLKTSTGPVVPFRATEFLNKNFKADCVPLIWIQHVKPMALQFPIDVFRKQQWIQRAPKSLKLLVANRNMILMRRFSPKEDFRRMTVVPYLKDDLDYDFLGLENHLNYIYRPNGQFSKEEVFGLSAFLNSEIFDAYFRILNGNTQVSATELRSAPLPDPEQLAEIGTMLLKGTDYRHAAIDAIVSEIVAKDLA